MCNANAWTQHHKSTPKNIGGAYIHSLSPQQTILTQCQMIRIRRQPCSGPSQSTLEDSYERVECSLPSQVRQTNCTQL